MKVIKTYELFNYKLEKGELILTDYTFTMKAIYLILKCEKSIGGDNIVRAFFIGTIDNKKVNLIFNTKNMKVKRIYTHMFLSKEEKLMVCKAIEKDVYYLDIIKEQTGIDLRESEDYKRYLIEKDIKKYNL